MVGAKENSEMETIVLIGRNSPLKQDKIKLMENKLGTKLQL